jgi:hypothetical protein
MDNNAPSDQFVMTVEMPEIIGMGNRIFPAIHSLVPAQNTTEIDHTLQCATHTPSLNLQTIST